MLATGFALFFIFLFFFDIIKAKKPLRKYDSFDIGYLTVIAGLALMFAWSPLKFWRLERTLSEQASAFVDRPGVVVECTSLFQSVFDPYDISRAGSAFIEEGRIVFHYGWCKNFMDYLDDPIYVNDDELMAMHVFTHEVMHIAGEYNEQKTDCQAVQRNHLLGEALGIHPFVAHQNAALYYKSLYKRHPYFSRDCAPGGKLDENLSNPIW